MQADGHGNRVAKRAGDGVCFKQCGNLRLTSNAVHSFADIEHQIPAVADSQSFYQLPHMANPVGFVSQPDDRMLK
jgi:hypothetical protein